MKVKAHKIVDLKKKGVNINFKIIDCSEFKHTITVARLIAASTN